jgi:hypothetical protein
LREQGWVSFDERQSLVGEARHWVAFCDWIDDMNARGTLPREKFDAVARRVDDLKSLTDVVNAVLDPTTGGQAFKALPICIGTPKS